MMDHRDLREEKARAGLSGSKKAAPREDRTPDLRIASANALSGF
jgi:hypothetical protein